MACVRIPPNKGRVSCSASRSLRDATCATAGNVWSILQEHRSKRNPSVRMCGKPCRNCRPSKLHVATVLFYCAGAHVVHVCARPCTKILPIYILFNAWPSKKSVRPRTTYRTFVCKCMVRLSKNKIGLWKFSGVHQKIQTTLLKHFAAARTKVCAAAHIEKKKSARPRALFFAFDRTLKSVRGRVHFIFSARPWTKNSA